MLDAVSMMVAASICLPAVIMAAQRSTWLIDYLFFVVALNRGIRRIVDYGNGEFNSLSLISLTPIIVGGLATLVVLIEINHRMDRFGTSTLAVLSRYALAISIGFAVGLVRVRFGAVYALGDYIAPIGLLGFAALYANRHDVLHRWCNSFALSALVVATYGIIQFYFTPPWDAFWVRAVNFEGYLGIPEPTKMTLFSTMAERGPAASYLCSGLILLLLRPATLGSLRWPAVAVVLTAMLLTYSRTVIIQTSLACILYPIVNRGSGLIPVMLLCSLVAVFGGKLLDKLPGSEMAAKRVGTLTNIHEDGSFRGRIQIMTDSVRAAITEPLGLGIGSHGLASRVNSKDGGGSGDSTGYVEILRTLGWIGFVLTASVLYRTWNSSTELAALDLDDENVNLFRAWFLSGMVAMFSGNWMFSASFFWILAGYSLGRLDGVYDAYAQASPDDPRDAWQFGSIESEEPRQFIYTANRNFVGR